MPQALRTVITLLVLGCIADTSVRPSTLLSHSIGQTQGNMACTMLWRLLACTALLVACFSAVHAGPAFTTPVPSHAAHYHPKNPQAFDLTDFNNFLYSPAAGAAKWVVLAAGTYTCDPTINDNFGHWNLHDMVIDMRGVSLWLTNPKSISYWDVETNLTIVGLSLWTRQEQWAQGIVKAASTNGDGSVQVTVASDVGYDHSIWFNGVPPVQPLRFMDSSMVAISSCDGLWATNGQYRDLGNRQVTFAVAPYNGCPASQITVGKRFAKATGGQWPQIIQEYSQINWIDVTSNLFFDSYGGSSPVYTNVYLINAATPSGATVRRSHPSTFKVQGWGYPATGSWYYLGYNPNGLDAEPVLHNAVTQNSADRKDLVSWW